MPTQCRYCPRILADRRIRDAHEIAIPPVDMATASGIAAPMGGLQNDRGAIDALATHSYHIGAPLQFIHYPSDNPGPEDMDASEDFAYPNNAGWSNY
ncbi:hypothetical protein M407DRAFT_26567 [Tulasnella calospora MUT 4182]|uniref:Uncharacterized protein n=1 Tax=Tulasnella calospora MUT 4182 TaxID=1051891 RepID=A0A0C3LRK6_9AGAM|nr:hypothetical protein M407DRAFT_26567 [Tulasnella calospora MUT 4182]